MRGMTARTPAVECTRPVAARIATAAFAAAALCAVVASAPGTVAAQGDRSVSVAGAVAGPGAALPAYGLVELGRYGGATRAVSTDGDRVIVGVGTTVHIYTMDESGGTRSLGAAVRMPGPVTALDAADGRVLVELAGQAVYAIDLRGPGPARIGRPLVGSVAVGQQGSRMVLMAQGVALIAARDSWQAVDVSDVSRPRILSEVALPGPSLGMALDGDRLFLLARVSQAPPTPADDASLLAWNVAAPASPVAHGPSEGLRFDVVTTLVAVAQDEALLLNRGRLEVIPVPVAGDWEAQALLTVTGPSHVVAGSAIYVAMQSPRGLARIDGPTYTVAMFSEVDRRIEHPPDVRAMHLDEDRLFVAYANGGVQAFDLANPEFPVPRGEPFAAFGVVADIALDRNTAWLATSQGLRVLEHGRGGPVRSVGEWPLASPLLAVDVQDGRGVVAGSRRRPDDHQGEDVVQSGYESLLHVIDGRDVQSPVLVRTIPRDGIPRDALVEGDRAYVLHRPGAIVALALDAPTRDAPSGERPRALAKLVRAAVGLEQLSLEGERLWATWHNDTFGVGFGDFGLAFWDVSDLSVTPYGSRLSRSVPLGFRPPAGAARGAAFGIVGPSGLTSGPGPATEDNGNSTRVEPMVGAMVDMEGMHLVRVEASLSLQGGPIDRIASLDLPLRTVAPGIRTPAFTPQRSDLVVQDGFAWIAAADAGLRAMDVRIPDQPDEVAWLTGPESIVGVDVAGPIVAVAAGEDGAVLLRWTGWAPAARLWLPWAGAGGAQRR